MTRERQLTAHDVSNGVVALVYQTTGSAIWMPIYYIAHTWVFAGDESGYFGQGRHIRASEANALLPALIMGYLVPTVAMYFPWSDWEATQIAIAVWQAAPFWPNLLVRVFSLGRTQSARDRKEESDIAPLHRVYFLAGAVCFAVHVGFLYACLTSNDPRVSFASVLLPDETAYRHDAAQGLLWIFQWDFFGCFLSTLVWAWVGVARAQRAAGEKVTLSGILTSGLAIAAASLLTGPGTAIAAAWYWMENKTADLRGTADGKDKVM